MHSLVGLWIVTTAGLFLWGAACSSSDDGREASSARPLTASKRDTVSKEAADANSADDTGDAGTVDVPGDDSEADAGTDSLEGSTDSDADIGGDDGAHATTEFAGETIESCSLLKKNWIAVVGGGTSPPACGEALVTWCCSRTEIKARFPALASQLDERFVSMVDNDKYKLYHCSTNAAATVADLRTTFHLAKTVNGSTCYKTIYVAKAAPAVNGAADVCPPQIATQDLVVPGPVCDDLANNDNLMLSFVADIQPILAASCAGADCHDNGGKVPATLQFNGDEIKFKNEKTRIAASLNNASMPPPASTKILSNTNKQKLIDFLGP